MRAIVPAVVLAAVAALQIVLTRTHALSPWKGGGFGMFATLDGVAERSVRVFVTAPERSEELRLPTSLDDVATRAALLPTRAAMERVAQAVARREHERRRPVADVRVSVWRDERDPRTLRANTRLVREETFGVDPAPAAPAAGN